jgi:enolase
MISYDKYYPKLQETQSAQKFFYNSVFDKCYKNGKMSIRTAVNDAIAEVWTEAKKYQDKQNKMCLIASLSYLGCQICSEVGETQ